MKAQSKVETKRRRRKKLISGDADEILVKTFKCKICDQIFDKSPLFTEHMRVVHSIEKPFECSICEKAYRIQSLLVEHYRSHTGEKPYKWCVGARSNPPKYCPLINPFLNLTRNKLSFAVTNVASTSYNCNHTKHIFG